ncbi:MAG: squalene/phytoene synthase family protein [Pseudomonadota bacterium]
MSETINAPTEVADFVDRATAPGSPAYLPTLFAPDEHRVRLGVAFALRGEIGRSLVPDLAPEVASTRLSWWGEEAGRVVAGAPRHPLTSYLAGAIDTSALSDPRGLGVLIAEMVGAAQATLSEPVPANWSALLHRMTHDWGAICRLMSRLFASPSEREATWIEPWANALGVACAIDEAIAATADEGLPPLSPDDTVPSDSQARVATWRGHAVASLHTAATAIPADARPSQRPLLVLASLVHRRSSSGKDGASSPHLARSLGELWCAWRSAQRAARGQLPTGLHGAPTVDSRP